MVQNKIIVFFWGVLFVFYLGMALFVLPVGTDDFRLVAVFSMDEVDIVTYVWNLVATDFHTDTTFKYGGAFYYLPAGFLYLWSLFGPVTEQMIVIVVRLFCTLSGLGCLWLTYFLGGEVFSRRAGLIATWLLGISPEFLRWAVESHPDLPQLFFLLGGLLFLCRYMRSFQLAQIVLAGACAGLAFGTKFAGIFMVPVFVVAVFASGLGGSFKTRMFDRQRWVHVMLMLGSFGLAFAATNPFALLDLSGFVNSLKAEREIMGFGHRIQDLSGPLAWLQMLATWLGLGHSVVLLGVVGWGIWAGRWRAIDRRWVIVGVWVIGFMGYLMGASALKFPRHLLPIVPCVLLFVGAAYEFLWDRVSGYLPRPFRCPGTIVLVAVIFSWGSVEMSAKFLQTRLSRETTQEELVVGRWLGDTFPENTSILNDPYAYVPAKFQFVMGSIGMTYGLVCHFEPDLLIVRDATVSDYADSSDATVARMGKDAFFERYFFYRYLQAGVIPTYRLLRDFGRIAVYERKAPHARPETLSWDDLKAKYVENRRYGQVTAFWTMGYVQLEQGDTVAAQVSFERAKESSQFHRRIFTHGIYMLGIEQMDAARHAFRTALAASEDESVTYQAQMRDELAVRYFQAGLYTDALEVAKQALVLDEHLLRSAFIQAGSHVILGPEKEGVAMFADAIARFGKDPNGIQVLNWLGRSEPYRDVAQRLKKRFYEGSP